MCTVVLIFYPYSIVLQHGAVRQYNNNNNNTDLGMHRVALHRLLQSPPYGLRAAMRALCARVLAGTAAAESESAVRLGQVE